MPSKSLAGIRAVQSGRHCSRRLGGDEIDRLVRWVRTSDLGAVEASIAAVIARGAKPRENHSIAGWHWFADHMAVPRQPVPAVEE